MRYIVPSILFAIILTKNINGYDSYTPEQKNWLTSAWSLRSTILTYFYPQQQHVDPSHHVVALIVALKATQIPQLTKSEEPLRKIYFLRRIADIRIPDAHMTDPAVNRALFSTTQDRVKSVLDLIPPEYEGSEYIHHNTTVPPSMHQQYLHQLRDLARECAVLVKNYPSCFPETPAEDGVLVEYTDAIPTQRSKDNPLRDRYEQLFNSITLQI